AGFRAEYTPPGALVSAVRWTNNEPTDGHVNVTFFGESPDDSQWIAGEYSGTVDLDPGPALALHTVDLFADHLYVSRFTPAGALQFAETFDLGSVADTGAFFKAADVDQSGGFVLTGYVDNGKTLDLDPGPGVSPVTGMSTYSQNFWTRLDSAGQLDWLRDFPDQNGPRSLTVLPSGQLLFYYTGVYLPTQLLDATHPLTVAGDAPLLIWRQSDGTW
ncbi:MAG: hypothetical protein ABI743_00090, partial [bacterium]